MNTDLAYKALPETNCVLGRCKRILTPCLVILLGALLVDYLWNHGQLWMPLLIIGFQIMIGSIIFSLIRGNRCPLHDCILEPSNAIKGACYWCPQCRSLYVRESN